MCSYGVREVSTGADEQVDRMVNGTSLIQRPIAGSGASGVAGLRGWRLVSTMSLQRLEDLWKVIEEVL